MRPVVDFHCHSTASDGTLSPLEVYQRACGNGAQRLALTDHDTVAGCRQLSAALASGSIERGAELVSGVEFSCLWGKRSIHVVGLGFDIDHPEIEKGVAQQTDVRQQRALTIDKRMQKLGFSGCLEGAKAIAGDSQIGRPHFAQFMLDQGYVTSTKQAFDRYLGSGKPGDVKSGWPALETVVGWIVDAGGVAVVAHPERYKLTRTKLSQLLDCFTAAGGRGIEMAGRSQHINTRRTIEELCAKYDLLASVGSDFHNPEYRWNDLAVVPTVGEGLTPIWQHVKAMS
ncbi:hypothetical protein EDC56_0266 [Sinobacterium caligoides]|uniref:Polymerase/histidinol phosphatase N-terminal domain-containing protein n=1 Tax=Sinobacterium caligoides TaxID=933926 RepID=A0A3N2DY42_9GAMM|nr:PHP domain-containing protein [Sinobacterium caligoides]ROS04753.1 hypothetical protein EDC56_0266 [Sinobacterium caligoides]